MPTPRHIILLSLLLVFLLVGPVTSFAPQIAYSFTFYSRTDIPLSFLVSPVDRVGNSCKNQNCHQSTHHGMMMAVSSMVSSTLRQHLATRISNRINPMASLSLFSSSSSDDVTTSVNTTAETMTPLDTGAATENATDTSPPPVPLYRSEGLLAVAKPLNWTSNDVVSYLRGILERDSRNRGAKPVKLGRRRPKKKDKANIVRVGHGGTLDPLATGVLVIGVGKGTKELQS